MFLVKEWILSHFVFSFEVAILYCLVADMISPSESSFEYNMVLFLSGIIDLKVEVQTSLHHVLVADEALQ